MLFLKKKNAFSLVCVVVFRVTCVLFSGILSAEINKEIKFFIIDSMFIIVVVLYCCVEAGKPHSTSACFQSHNYGSSPAISVAGFLS